MIKDIFESYGECKDHEILLSLIQYYLVSEVEQDSEKSDGGNKDTNLSHALYNHIKLRLFCIDLLNKLFEKVSVEYKCLKEILSILDKLSFISVVEMNSSIVKLCTTILNRISQTKTANSNLNSIIVEDGEGDVNQSKVLEKELHIVTIIEKLSLKIMSQMQNFVYQDPNLGELRRRLTDKMFDGLEGNFMDATNKTSVAKLTLMKDAFELQKQCFNSLIAFKLHCTNKTHLNKLSEDISENLKNSFEVTIHRVSCTLPLHVKSFAKYYFASLSTLIDSVCEHDAVPLSDQFNNMIIRLLSTIKVCNSIKVENDHGRGQIRESSEEDSESNSDYVDTNQERKIDSKKAEDLKATILFMVQLLNKAVVNACFSAPVEKIKDGLVFYMTSLFGTKEDKDHRDTEIVDFRQMALKGLNSIFATSTRDKEGDDDKISLFSKYCFEESLVFLFYNVQKIFSNPSLVEGEDQNLALTLGEAIKFISNIYLHSNSDQKEVIIDPIIKLFLGVLVGMHENKIQRTKSVLVIINATGEALYSMILLGDQALAKNYIANSLNDTQKQMLQNIIKAISSTKKAQEESEQKLRKELSKPGQSSSASNKFKETQSKIKLATRIGK